MGLLVLSSSFVWRFWVSEFECFCVLVGLSCAC